MDMSLACDQAWNKTKDDSTEREQFFKSVIEHKPTRDRLFGLAGMAGKQAEAAFNLICQSGRYTPEEILKRSGEVVDKLATLDNLHYALLMVYFGYTLGRQVEQTESLEKMMSGFTN